MTEDSVWETHFSIAFHFLCCFYFSNLFTYFPLHSTGWGFSQDGWLLLWGRLNTSWGKVCDGLDANYINFVADSAIKIMVVLS